MSFSCKVTIPGPYTDSVSKARELEKDITKSAEKAMSYVMNLQDPAVPVFDVFKPAASFVKLNNWINSFVKVNLIRGSIDKAKAVLGEKKHEDAGMTMEAYLRTEGVAELLDAAAMWPSQDFKLDHGTAALASAAWYLKASVRCVGRRAKAMGDSAEFVKKGDKLFKEVIERSSLTKRQLLSIKCKRGKIWDRLPLAMLTWAYGKAHPYCGRHHRGGGTKKPSGVNGFAPQPID